MPRTGMPGGWHKVWTRDGDTALRLDLHHGWYILATDDSDGHIPSTDNDVIIGMYDERGVRVVPRIVVSWYQWQSLWDMLGAARGAYGFGPPISKGV